MQVERVIIQHCIHVDIQYNYYFWITIYFENIYDHVWYFNKE